MDVKADKKLLTVLFPDGRDGRAFTLKVLFFKGNVHIFNFVFSYLFIYGLNLEVQNCLLTWQKFMLLVLLPLEHSMVV